MTTALNATTSFLAIEQMNCAKGCLCLLRVGLTGDGVPWAATVTLSSDYFGGGVIGNTWAHCLKYTNPKQLRVRPETGGYVLADDTSMAEWLEGAKELRRAIYEDELGGTPADFRPIAGVAWDNSPISAPAIAR